MTRPRGALTLLAGALLITGCAGFPGPLEASDIPTQRSAPPASSSTSAEPAPDTEPTSRSGACRAFVDQMTPQEQAGQLFMVAITNADRPDAATLSVIDEYEIGSVLLLGNTSSGVDHVRGFTDEIRNTLAEDVLIAVDQEGGVVQRLEGPGFEQIPNAMEQADMTDLRSAAQRWGEELAAAGVDVNLAPVADVVPQELASINAPVGQLRRGYGHDPEQAAESVRAFVEGMSQAGVGTSVKHYPSLGHVRGNPDHQAEVVDSAITRDGPDQAPFAAAVDAGVPMVMISSATYTQIDPDRQGVFSPVILQEMLRDDLGFDGVAISDDLGVAVNLAAVPVEERGWRFIQAGGDVVINADPSKASAMVERVLSEMADDDRFAEQVARSATRVLDLKEDLGRVQCGAR